ncbi:MAG: acyl carrier protein [Nostoc sp.]|uniref:acyl carrier protein n=1 Tax=Nostoc sp. TaxID=1180 RepID=UPI002FFCD16B
MDTLKIILTDLGVAEEFIHEDTCLRRDLQLDSMETVEVALGLKRKLGINIKLGNEQDVTLAQLCNLVEVQINTR